MNWSQWSVVGLLPIIFLSLSLGPVFRQTYSEKSLAMVEAAREWKERLTDDKDKGEVIESEMKDLYDKILSEEAKIKNLSMKMNRARDSTLWFLDSSVRDVVDIFQLQINDHTRIIQNDFEDIQVHWKRLKPLFGIASKMFVWDFITSGVSWFAWLGEQFLLNVLELGIISLFLFGPISIFVTYAIWLAGLFCLPVVIGCWAISMTVKFPFMLIVYDPTPFQFFSCMIAFSGSMIAAVYGSVWALRNESAYIFDRGAPREIEIGCGSSEEE